MNHEDTQRSEGMIQVEMTEAQLDVIIGALRAQAVAAVQQHTGSHSGAQNKFDTDVVRALHDMERVKSGAPAIRRVEPLAAIAEPLKMPPWWPAPRPDLYPPDTTPFVPMTGTGAPVMTGNVVTAEEASA